MSEIKPIDIFIVSYERAWLTGRTLRLLRERTKYPHRIFLIDNGGNFENYKLADIVIENHKNLGIHASWNMALALAESEYFVTSDNDIFVPDLEPDWLTQLVGLMDQRLDYGAISLHPHVFIGAESIDPNHPDDVVERNMCGAVMRIMRRSAVWKAGGWENKIEAGRNHEERTICSRLQTAGYKVGITSRIRAYHPFPDNWGYPSTFTPEMQKHNPELKDYVKSFDRPENYDPKTYLPK